VRTTAPTQRATWLDADKDARDIKRLQIEHATAMLDVAHQLLRQAVGSDTVARSYMRLLSMTGPD
jgi:hypothetical protein